MKITKVIRNLIVKSAIGIVGIIVFAFIFNTISPNGLNLITPFRNINVGEKQYKIPIFQTRKIHATQREEVPLHAPEEINLKKALNFYQENTALFIDTRNTEDYINAHIPRSISIPLETLDLSGEVLPGLSKNQKIVTYCDGEDCSQSIDLAVHLGEVGFNDVYFFFGGWNQWQKAGYPQSSGEQP